MMYKISVAPMVDRTTEHFRNFIRMFNKSSMLYTEMITAQAVINGDKKRLLDFSNIQHPIAFQLASSDPNHVKEAMKYIKEYDYDEININAGCPSNRVSDNKMGAYLMSDINLLKEIVLATLENTNKKVSVKHRIGIDGKGVLLNDRKIESYEELLYFVDSLNEINVNKFIVHARIAILKGLSPAENRNIPPLNYDVVYKLKKDRPNLQIEINGGIKTLEQVEEHLKIVDRVMLGRAIVDNPLIIKENNISHSEILEKIYLYTKDMNTKPYHFLMTTMGLFYGTKFSKKWKNIVSNPNCNHLDILNFIKINNFMI